MSLRIQRYTIHPCTSLVQLYTVWRDASAPPTALYGDTLYYSSTPPIAAPTDDDDDPPPVPQRPYARRRAAPPRPAMGHGL